ERRPTNKLSRGFFTTFAQVKGSISARHLQAGSILRPAQLITQKLVKKGDKVTILAKSKSFKIHMSGHALMDGRLGDTIRVKNSKSKRIIEGTVIRSGVISVN
ncbi:MAG: flagellar basal body P-ring formation chaperone FlgA, partial [Methyloprofundus sp.]|nr:flagellar basal body P-ring formation chaperone FlgA [Methyloprofundus sp.]